MREKLGPWLPAIFCAIVSVITVVGNLVLQFMNGTTNGVALVFYCFMPMCFFFVGVFLSQLQKENGELRSRIDELTKADVG